MERVNSLTFHEQLKQYTDEAEAVIRSFLPEENGEASSLIEAMNYSMTAGGKRLRPILMKMSYEMFGGTGAAAEPFMAAMEMIHTQSLVHDDLPAMDNDDYRRGKKTTHVVFGEAAAILAGDALLNLAYETAAGSMSSAASSVEPSMTASFRSIRALAILAEKTGYNGMIGGQSVDVKLEGCPLDEDQLDFIYRKKTGALIEASLMIGACLAGADTRRIGVMEQIGRKVGIAFQIRDDILDEIGNEEKLGKPLHSDERNGKTTYVSLYGIEKADADVQKLTEEAMQLLDGLECSHPVMRELLLSLVRRDK